MGCGKKMKWSRAMRIAREEYPHMPLERRKSIAAHIAKGRHKLKL